MSSENITDQVTETKNAVTAKKEYDPETNSYNSTVVPKGCENGFPVNMSKKLTN